MPINIKHESFYRCLADSVDLLVLKLRGFRRSLEFKGVDIVEYKSQTCFTRLLEFTQSQFKDFFNDLVHKNNGIFLSSIFNPRFCK